MTTLIGLRYFDHKNSRDGGQESVKSYQMALMLYVIADIAAPITLRRLSRQALWTVVFLSHQLTTLNIRIKVK
jgi:hypothetical protein